MGEHELRVDVRALAQAGTAVAAVTSGLDGAQRTALPALLQAGREVPTSAVAPALDDLVAAASDAVDDVLAALDSLGRGLSRAATAFAANDAAAARAVPQATPAPDPGTAR